MRSLKSLFISMVVLTAYGTNIFAQDIEMDDLFDLVKVVTPSRTPLPLKESPSIIDVITSEQIKRSGAKTLADVLVMLPGIQFAPTLEGTDMIIVRGIGAKTNDKTLLLVDGIPYRTLFLSYHPVNEQFPLGDIERIEVIRGPGSALYGSNAFAGVINVITKKAKDITKNEISAEIGNWKYQNYGVLFGQSLGEMSLTFHGRVLDEEGFNLDKNEKGELTDIKNSSEIKDLNVKGEFKNLIFGIRHSDSDDVSPNVEANKSETNRRVDSLFHLDYAPKLSEKIKADIKGYLKNFETEIVGTEFNVGGGIDKTEIETRKGRIIGTDSNLLFDINESIDFIVGGTFEHEEQRLAIEREFAGTDPVLISGWLQRVDGSSTPIVNNNWSIYSEAHINILQSLGFTAGFRYDENQQSGSALSPRGALVWNPIEKLTMKVLYGEAVRFPSYREIYQQTKDNEDRGNINLKAEKIRTTEFAASYRFSKFFNATANYFFNEYKNYIRIQNDENYVNLPIRRTQGVEVGLKGILPIHMTWFANYAYVNGEDFNQVRIPGFAPHTFNVGINFTGIKYVNLNTWVRYVGRRNRPLDYQSEVVDSLKRDNLGEFYVTNVSVTLSEIFKPFEFSIFVTNLFNKKYYYPEELTASFEVEEPSRRIVGKVTYKF